MNNSQKIEKLHQLKQSINQKERDIYFIDQSENIMFEYEAQGMRDSYPTTRYINPSDNLLLNIKQVAIKILKEEIAEMQKEIESIFASWSSELE